MQTPVQPSTAPETAQPLTAPETAQQCNPPAVTPANNTEDTAQCRIINLHLLNVHIKDIIQHIATCSTCLEMTQSKDDSVMVVGETHHKGLASMLGCQFGYGKRTHICYIEKKLLACQAKNTGQII